MKYEFVVSELSLEGLELAETLLETLIDSKVTLSVAESQTDTVSIEFLTNKVRKQIVGVVKESGLRVRNLPGLDGKIVGYMGIGDTVEILGDHVISDGWKWRKFEDGWFAELNVLDGRVLVDVFES